MNIFVGSLSAAVTAEDLRAAFAEYGTIIDAVIVRDTETGWPRGYGHVYMVPETAAHEAILHLDRTFLKDSSIAVRECRYRSHLERRQHSTPWKAYERRTLPSRRQYESLQESQAVSERTA